MWVWVCCVGVSVKCSVCKSVYECECVCVWVCVSVCVHGALTLTLPQPLSPAKQYFDLRSENKVHKELANKNKRCLWRRAKPRWVVSESDYISHRILVTRIPVTMYYCRSLWDSCEFAHFNIFSSFQSKNTRHNPPPPSAETRAKHADTISSFSEVTVSAEKAWEECEWSVKTVNFHGC